MQVMIQKDKKEGPDKIRRTCRLQYKFYICERKTNNKSEITEEFQGFIQVSKESLSQSLLLKEYCVSQKWACISILNCA